MTDHPKELTVTAGKLAQTLMEIREGGGWVPRMDVDGVTYKLKIVWTEKQQEQQELI